MPSPYRIIVTYWPERAVYEARAPELPACAAEGASRAEAVANLEQEIAAQLAIIAERGGAVPAPVDALAVASPAGRETDEAGSGGPGAHDATQSSKGLDAVLQARVSPGLRRALLYLARVEGIPLDNLLGELLAESLALREARTLRPAGSPQMEPDRARREREPGVRGPGEHPDYNRIMGDSSTFLEYVRTLEQRPRGPGRGRGKSKSPRRKNGM